MTTATYTTMQNLAKQAAAYITEPRRSKPRPSRSRVTVLRPLSHTTPRSSRTRATTWTAPSWSIEDETVAVEAVINEDGNEDEEAADMGSKSN